MPGHYLICVSYNSSCHASYPKFVNKKVPNNVIIDNSTNNDKGA